MWPIFWSSIILEPERSALSPVPMRKTLKQTLETTRATSPHNIIIECKRGELKALVKGSGGQFKNCVYSRYLHAIC